MAINYKNPIFQKKILSGMADPHTNKLGVQKNITEAWATDQTAWQSNLARLGLQKEIHESNLKHSYDRLAFQKDQFNIGMKNAKEAAKLSMYGGVGNALVAGMFGRQKRKDMERQYKMQLRIAENLENKYGLGNTEGVY